MNSRNHGEGLNGAVVTVLRHARGSANLTIEELADASGIPTVTVQRLLSAHRALTVATLGALCRGLDVDIVDVMTAAVAIHEAGDPELVARVMAELTVTT